VTLSTTLSIYALLTSTSFPLISPAIPLEQHIPPLSCTYLTKSLHHASIFFLTTTIMACNLEAFVAV